MGYACPVCTVPQRDAEHLANHLAFTAMLHGDEHEAWLDDHVPEWADLGPTELADRVEPHAEAAEYESVFEDTVHDHGPTEHDDPPEERSGALFDEEHAGNTAPFSPRGEVGSSAIDDRPLDEESEAILEEARRLTEEMLNGDGESDEE